MQQISSVTLADQNLILIAFSQLWEQEDIGQLSALLFAKLDEARIIEKVKGADREYLRFNYQQEYLIMHFESYSNACWIETEDQLASLSLATIAKKLTP